MKLSRKASTLALAAAIALGSLTSGAHAQGVVVPHAQGETVLRETPARVAVYDLASLDILNALGVDAVAGVAKSAEDKSNFPPHIAHYGTPKYRAVGSLFEPDMAALAELKPDLILVGGRSAKKYEALSAIAPTVDMSTRSSDVAGDAIANTRKLARAFNREARAEEKIAAFQNALAGLRAQGSKAGKAVFVFTAGENASVQGPDGRFGHVHDFIGLPSTLAPAPKSDAPAAPRPAAGSPEAAAARARQQEALANAMATNPDWLIVLDRTAATSMEPSNASLRLAANAQISASKAWKAGRVIYLDPKTWYLVGAGIDALTQSATDIAATLHAAG